METKSTINKSLDSVIFSNVRPNVELQNKNKFYNYISKIKQKITNIKKIENEIGVLISNKSKTYLF